MRTQKDKKNVALKDLSSLESQTFNDESGSFEGILAKRSSNDTSLEQLRAETEDSVEDQEGSHDPNDKRERR